MAAAPSKYVQGRDYDGKIAVNYEATDSHLRTNGCNTDQTAIVHVWSIECGEDYDWSKQPVLKLAGKVFLNRCVPLTALLGGREGRIITIQQFNIPFRFLCAQNEKLQAYSSFSTESRPFENVISYIFPLHPDKNYKAFLEKTLALSPPSIQTGAPSSFSLPAQQTVLAKRQDALFRSFQEERSEGKTGFKLKVANGQDIIPVHSLILQLNSKFFERALASGMAKGITTDSEKDTVFEVAAPFDALNRLVDYLYDNTLDAKLTIDQCLDLIELNSRFELNSETTCLPQLCLPMIKAQMTDMNLWTVLAFANQHHLQQLLDLVMEYLAEKKANLFDLIELPDVLQFAQENLKSRIPLIPFFCEQFRAYLIQTKDAGLWFNLHQFSRKNKGAHQAVTQFHEACISLAIKFPPYLVQYIQENSLDNLSKLGVPELREKISDATQLQCSDVLSRCMQIVGL